MVLVRTYLIFLLVYYIDLLLFLFGILVLVVVLIVVIDSYFLGFHIMRLFQTTDLQHQKDFLGVALLVCGIIEKILLS
jgi:hypothetical protein